jgi:DNA-binding FadR family transcriptional regulator
MLRTKPRAGLVDALFELRAIIEPEAAALAAQRRTRQHLDAIGQALAVMRKSTALASTWRRGTQDFHVAILHASGNPFLKTLTHGISTAVGATIKQHGQPPRSNPIREHERVYNCIAGMDAEGAREAMLDLLELAALDTHT